MFWNTELIDTTPSNIDVMLGLQAVELVDILFEEDLLQELKTSNVNLGNFLTKPEIIRELVENITQLTEKDCSTKEVYSRVHSAYLSCEILTSGVGEIVIAFMEHPDCLDKILTCLIDKEPPKSEPLKQQQLQQKQEQHQQIEDQQQLEHQDKEDKENTENKEDKEEKEDTDNQEQDQQQDVAKAEDQDDKTDQEEYNSDILNILSANENIAIPDQVDDTLVISAENPPETLPPTPPQTLPEATPGLARGLAVVIPVSTSVIIKTTEERLPPEKVTLVSKLINSIHSSHPCNLSCHITKDTATFSRLIDTLISNIDMSSSFELLGTFISKTIPPDMRFVYCEILSKLNFVQKLIDVMTLSTNEDKQRNACLLLCDIIVIGRSENADGGFVCDRTDFDMLSQTMQSREAVGAILKQIFNHDGPSPTSIVCGLKVLQTLIEKLVMLSLESIAENINLLEEELDEYLIKLHDILIDPPKQQSIKTTFGIIERPLGYLRFEIINFIKALIGTKSHRFMARLIDLKVMQVIIDLFFEFSWNNLIHTQVEQALKMITDLCEDSSLIDRLIKESDLIVRLLSALISETKEPTIGEVEEAKRNGSTSQSMNRIQNQNIGHIYEILRHIKLYEEIEPIKRYIDELKVEKLELWQKWNEIPREEKKKNIISQSSLDEHNVTSSISTSATIATPPTENSITINTATTAPELEPTTPSIPSTETSTTTMHPIRVKGQLTVTTQLMNIIPHHELRTGSEMIASATTNSVGETPNETGAQATRTKVEESQSACKIKKDDLANTHTNNKTKDTNDVSKQPKKENIPIEQQQDPKELTDNPCHEPQVDTSYDLFTREMVFPRINKDVIPRIRRPIDN